MEIVNGNENLMEKEMEKTLKELISLIKDDDSIQMKDDNKSREILKRFLRARKFNVERAFKSVRKYVTLKTTHASLLAEARPEVFKNLYAKHSPAIMVNKDREGRQIVWIRGSSWDPAEFTYLEWLLSVYIMLEEMVLSVDTQINGIIMICDFRGLNLHQITHCSRKPVEILIEILQETLPVSFKEIHIVNHSVLFTIGWAMAKPFIKEKLRKRIHFHGNNMENFHKFTSPSILPSELGGHLSLERAVDNDFLNSFLQKNSLYTY